MHVTFIHNSNTYNVQQLLSALQDISEVLVTYSCMKWGLFVAALLVDFSSIFEMTTTRNKMYISS